MSHATLHDELDAKQKKVSWIIWTTLAGLMVFLVWAYFSPLDEVTIGTGKVTPSSHAQKIDSLDGGVILNLLVQEGSIVHKGQLLAKLDPIRSQSNYGEAASRVQTLRAETERITAELTGAPLKFSADVLKSPDLVARETQLYISRKQNRDETVKNLQRSLLLVNQEINMTQPLVAKGAAGEVEVIRLKRQASELSGKINEAINQYAVRAREEQVKTNGDLDAELQVMAGKKDQVTRSELYSPVHGIVKDIQVSTVGGVLQPGGKLMEIVPIEDQLLIETRINPRDIAHIRPALPATVKISAYDSSIYGNLAGKVESVSPDTLQDEVKRDQFYYRVYIRTNKAFLTNRIGRRFPIVPGMVASVEIKTGEKTVLQYLIKPLNKVKDSLRER